jgi:hypothetical protein
LRQEGNVARSGINKREIDKWAKNFVREATSSPVPGEVTGYLARLLLWLDDREKQNPGGYINVTAFPEELRLEDEDPAILALQLDQNDLVQIPWGPSTMSVSPTPAASRCTN